MKCTSINEFFLECKLPKKKVYNNFFSNDILLSTFKIYRGKEIKEMFILHFYLYFFN
jgi:hypothetical protein